VNKNAFPVVLLLLLAVGIAVLALWEHSGPGAGDADRSRPATSADPSAPRAPLPSVKPDGHIEGGAAPVFIADRPVQRVVHVLGDGWLFSKGDHRLAKEPVSDPSSWERVAVPHSWNVADGADGGGYYRGPAWYRTWVDIPESERGKSIHLKFLGSNIITTVYVNGEWVGEHAGGFGAFAFEITPQVRFGSPNLIAVRVTNADNLEVYPVRAEFTFSGGIYRPVALITSCPLHLDLTTDGANGVVFHQRKVAADAAEIDAEVTVRNDATVAAAGRVVVGIRDRDGTLVASAQVDVAVDARRHATITVPLRIERPHRWHGVQNPYLYTTTVQVRSGEVVVDEMGGQIGLRSFRMDPARGFLLNDQPYDLHGVCLHQDRLGKGWIVSDEDRQEDVALLRELGATFVRLVHYQHAQETYDLLDRAGIVAWTELPILMQTGHTKPYADSAHRQLRELIRQNANHPSIVCWGLFNEIAGRPEDVALIKDLDQVAQKLDPYRPTTAATFAADTAEINHVTQVVSFNKYFGWYLPGLDAFGPWADKFHARYPDRAVGITEYGAGGSIRQHEEDPQPPVPGLAKFVPTTHSESYQARFHQTAWPQLASRPFLWCKAAWVLCDYTADQTTTGDAAGYNDMGLVTGDRKIRKDAFYYYKAQWSDQPVLHITNRRFRQRAPQIDLTVYANVTDVEVKVNGQALPAVTPVGGVYVWKKVPLQAGVNTVEASGERGGHQVRDRVEWERVEATVPHK
jgi:beta-galactosidase